MPREEVLSISQPRFQELKRLCGSYGAHFVYVIAPGFGIQEGAIVEAGSRAGVPVVVPVHSDAWPPSKFSDGFHLNEAAARVAPHVPVVGQLHGTELLMLEQIAAGAPREFTEKLSPALDSLLASYDFAAK